MNDTLFYFVMKEIDTIKKGSKEFFKTIYKNYLSYFYNIKQEISINSYLEVKNMSIFSETKRDEFAKNLKEDVEILKYEGLKKINEEIESSNSLKILPKRIRELMKKYI